MTGKGSIHKHGSRESEVAGDLGAKISGNAVNRSFNALARGQFGSVALTQLGAVRPRHLWIKRRS